SDHSLFLSTCSDDHQDLHSFPTRRSSDLKQQGIPCGIYLFIGQIVSIGLFTDAIPKLRNRNLSFVKSIKQRVLTMMSKKIIHVLDRKSTRLNSSHVKISYAVFCLKKKK